MCGRIVLLGLLLVSFYFGFSQNSKRYVDSVTYVQYKNADWKALIKTGKDAEKYSIQFYYLDYRMGIAYYESGKYLQAIPYFKRLLLEYNDDVAVYNYLYYSYVLTGQTDEAEFVKSQVPKDLSTIITSYKMPFIKNISCTGLSSQVNLKSIENLNLLFIDSISGVIPSAPKDFQGLVFSSTQNLFPTFQLTEMYSSFEANYYQNFTQKDTTEIVQSNQSQNQYYISASKYVSNGWRFNVAGHFIQSSSQYFEQTKDTSYNTITENEEIVSQFGQTVYNTFTIEGIPEYSYNIQENSLLTNSYAWSAGIEKRSGLFVNSVSFSYSNLWDIKGVQYAFDNTFYPFGNTNFYLFNHLMLKQNISYKTEKTQYLVNHKIGKQFGKNLSVDVKYNYGNSNNYVDYGASSVYNTKQLFKNSWGVDVNIYLFSKRVLCKTSFERTMYQLEYFSAYSNGVQNNTYYGSINSQIYSPKGVLLNEFTQPYSRVIPEDITQVQITNYNLFAHTLKTSLIWYF